jgi:predicted methyltransferase
MFAAAGVMLAVGAGYGVTLAAERNAGPATIAEAVDYYGRPPLEIERDAALKPADVMAFAGIKPGMIAAEIRPFGGYYARVMSRIVGDKGAVYAIVPRMGNERDKPTLVKEIDHDIPVSEIDLARSLEEQPEFTNISAYHEPIGEAISVPKQLDFVLLADAYHTFKSPEFAKLDMAKVNKAVYDAMKNGGLYVVLDNAANPGTSFADAAKLDRVDADAVKAEILVAGFTFDGESKVLARLNDDHAKPTDDLFLGKNEAMKTIPADMFVFRFKKPMNAPNTDLRPSGGLIAAVAGYFGNTRRGTINAGAQRERRQMYHSDGKGGVVGEDFGPHDSSGNTFQSGTVFYAADGRGCIRHRYPDYARDGVYCSFGRIKPGMKAGDTWVDETDRDPKYYPNGRQYMLAPGKVYFDN